MFYCNRLPGHVGVIHVDRDSGNATAYRLLDGTLHVHSDEEGMGYYALGYSMTADRIFQMDKLRRVSQGRLSEMFGESTVELDKALRNLGIEKLAQRVYDNLKPQTQANFDSYTEGINDYLNMFSLGIEYWLLGIQYSNETVVWKSTDSLSIYLFMMFGLSESFDAEIYRDYLFAKLQDQELVDQILPIGSKYEIEEIAQVINDQELKDMGFYKEGGSKINHSTKKRKTYEFIENNMDQELEFIKDLKNAFTPTASNCWAISGKHTKTGEPLLVNDPHLAASLPSSFYLAELNIVDDWIVGAVIPGTPLFVSSRTKKIAYGATALNADTMDLFEEKIDGDKYEFKGQWKDLEIREEVIDVRNGESQTIFIRSTHHGPVLDHVGASLSLLMPQFPPIRAKADIALSWIGYHVSENDFIELLVDFKSHDNVHDLIKASKGSSSSTFGACFADSKGNIGAAP